ncbi:hypothetical protein [Paraburkholderia sp. 2C]|jgi:hypothetical protein
MKWRTQFDERIIVLNVPKIRNSSIIEPDMNDRCAGRQIQASHRGGAMRRMTAVVEAMPDRIDDARRDAAIVRAVSS